MKKILALFTLLFASSTLAGCYVDGGTDDPAPDTYTVTLTSDTQDATLTQDPEGPHEAGDEVEVSASWDEDSHAFLRWEEDGETLSGDPAFTYRVEDDATLNAVFEAIPPEPETYDVTLSSDYAEASLTQNPEGPHESGDTVEISATWSDDSYDFVRWEEDGVNVSETATFDYAVDGDATLEAVFEEATQDPETHSITLNSDYEGATLTQTPEGPHESGDTVEILATWNDDSHEFVRWEEDGVSVSESPSFTHTVEGDTTLLAVFEEVSTAEPATYTETFEDLPPSGSMYESGTFTGVNGIEWTYSDVRGDRNIDGSKAATLSKVESGRDPYISATIPEGIKAFSVEYTNPFTTPAQLEFLINGESVAVSEEVDGTVGLFEVSGIDVPGTFDMELRALNGQTTIDNLTWDNFVEGSNDPEVTLTSNYWDADLSVSPSEKEPAGTDVTVSASDPHGDYAFLRWEDPAGDMVSEDAEYTFTLQEDTELHAVFDNPDRVELTLDSNLYRADLSMDETMPVVPGTEVTVSASDPDGFYDFLGWETEDGTELSPDETFTYTMGSVDATIHAVFDVEASYDYDTMTLDELTDLELSSEYDSLEGLYGDELRTAMQALIDDVTLQTYGDARTILADTDEDPENPDNIILFYTRQSVDGEWDGGATWNREHIWPQSLMPEEADNADANMASDLHALVPTDQGENSARGNQHYTLEGEGGYEPHDEVKGDASRMLFYMDVMYSELTLVDGAPSGYEMGDLSTLLGWHVADDISDYEDSRNDVIESYQGNRNPFIDYPHLAYLIYYDHPEVGLD